jgi:predicted nucleic acid-binding protein
MKKLKIYLESTMFNYYFDEDRDAHADTVTLFEECAAGKFEPYTSDYVLAELDAAPAPKREHMLNLIEKYNVQVLSSSEETNVLAEKYIVEGALPEGSLTDARHIAMTTVGDLDIIVSLNFGHIVKEKTREMTGAINKIRGYNVVKILSPMEVLDSDKTRYNFERDLRNSTKD